MSLAEQAEEAGNPYKGLDAFTESDADRFFGREKVVDQLWQRLRDLCELPPGGARPLRLLPILGPSGSGKSSVARAGLLPALLKRPIGGMRAPRVAVLTPGTRPLEALSIVLARIAGPDKPRQYQTEKDIEKLLRGADGEGNFDGLRRFVDGLDGVDQSPLVVLIDQFEELYSLADNEADTTAFIRNLLCAAADRSGRVTVVMTLRSDFLHSTMREPELNVAISRQSVIVPSMMREDLERAISEPARLTGTPLDPATVALLLNEAESREGALPLLQFALSRIWEDMQVGMASADALKRIGGVGGALADEASRLYERLPKADQRIVRRAFLRMVRFGEGVADTRRRANLSEIVAEKDDPEHVLEVLRAFSRPGQRLISLAAEEPDLGVGEPVRGITNFTKIWVEVSHEAIFKHWASLRKWIDEGRSDEIFRRRVRDAARNWDERGRKTGSLWRQPDLELLRRYHKRHSQEMSKLELDFYRSSERFGRFTMLARVAAALVLVATTGGATWFAVAASEAEEVAQTAADNAEVAKAEAESQRDRAEQALDRAAQEKRRADEERNNAVQQLRQAQIAQARFRASKATELLSAGDASTALALALTAMPQANPGGWPNLHETPEVPVALTQALLERREISVLRGHQSGVRSAAFSPDGSWVVTASSDATARIWKAASGSEITVLRGHEKGIESFVFSPDGTWVVTASRDNTARIWDAVTGAEIAVLRGHGRNVTSVAFSPDGTRVATASSDATARIWDVTSATEIAVLRKHKLTVTSAAFSPDGRRVVTASNDGTARIWNAATGVEIDVLRGHENGVISAVYSPDGTRVVTASHDNTARIWDVEERLASMWGGVTSATEIAVLSGHGDVVKSATFSRDGMRVITTSGDGTARIWDAVSGAEVVVMRGHEAEVVSAAFSPDGKWVVTASSDGTARIWDAVSGAEVVVMRGHEARVVSAAFSPDGKRVVTASSDGTARLWGTIDAIEVAILRGHQESVRTGAFSPDGRRVVTASSDGTARIWDAVSGAEVVVMRGHEAEVVSAAFSPDGKRVVTASSDGTARIWDASEHRSQFWEAAGLAEIAVLRGHGAEVVSAAFSPDGTRVVTASRDSTARIWDATSGAEVAVLSGHGAELVSAAFSSDGTRIVTASTDNTARIWDAASGVEIVVLQGHEGPVWSAAFSPDGKRGLTASEDATARIWDAVSGAEIAVLLGHSEVAKSAAFSPDGARVITASLDETARIWDAASGVEVAVLRGHMGPVWSAAFSPDGGRVVTASWDDTVRIWEVGGGTETAVLRGHGRTVASAAFSPDGTQILSISGNKVARLWHHYRTMEELYEHASKVVEKLQPLTEEEKCEYYLKANGCGSMR